MELPAAGQLDPRRVHGLLSLLVDGRWWPLTDLVRATATPRRSVEALLADVAAERDGERFRLTAERVESCRALLGNGRRPFTAADPVQHLLGDHAGVLARLTGLIAAAPRGDRALDHVAATPDTVVRRALLLGARFWLTSARVLCVGDHDLTSLAIALIHPDVRVTVVDVDERVLAYVDRVAGELGLDVRTRWADLRLGLPRSVREDADVTITDPPYTPDGVALFVARAVEALREPDRGRVLLAYGASDRTPVLALKVQRALHRLNLVFEAVYPDFNRYVGAEAIGSAADLYVLAPTSRTAAAVAELAGRTTTSIYTRGPRAVEAGDAPPPDAALAGWRPDLLVGPWPAGVLPGTPRVRLSTWLDRPFRAAAGEVAVTLPAGMGGALVRVLLAATAERVRVVLAGDPAGVADLRAAEPVYELAVRGSVVDARRRALPAGPRDAADRVLRHILDRAHGRLVNTWREALIAARAPDMTKRQARAAVLAAAPWAEGVSTLELPVHRLVELPDAVRATLAADPSPSPP